MRQRIFVTQPIAESAVARMKAVGEVEVYPDDTKPIAKDLMIEGVRRADIIFCLLHDKVDREVIAANPRLRGIASMAIMPADIDVAEATARKIPVTVIPPIVTEATADVSFALMLAVARRIVEGDRLIRAGIYPGGQSNHLAGGGVTGKVIALAWPRRGSGRSVKSSLWAFSILAPTRPADKIGAQSSDRLFFPARLDLFRRAISRGIDRCRARLRPCSTISMPSCRAPTPARSKAI